MRAIVINGDFIKSQEALSLIAYHGKCDKEGIYTIGWGHTKGVRPGDRISREQAENFLRDDLAWVERILNADLVSGRDNPIVTQNEYDALCSLVFNIGSQAYLDSTVRRKIKQGDKMGAAHAFGMWIYSNHKIAPGPPGRLYSYSYDRHNALCLHHYCIHTSMPGLIL